MSLKPNKKQVHYLKDDPRAKFHQPQVIKWTEPNILGGRRSTADLKYLVNHYYFRS